ncbi:hypothetical protein DM828_30170 [Pseudomonas umsongensis]|nr:hypothetical protein [Pseudomonas umsongensis]
MGRLFIHNPESVENPCRSCRRLRSFDLDLIKNQKIAACGSSYTGWGTTWACPPSCLPRNNSSMPVPYSSR